MLMNNDKEEERSREQRHAYDSGGEGKSEREKGKEERKRGRERSEGQKEESLLVVQ